METAVPVLGIAALVYMFVNFAKMVRSGDVNGSVTQVVVWLAGIAAVALYAHTGYADGLEIGGRALATASGADQVLIGVSIASAASVGVQVLKALDGTQSAKTAPLLPPKDGQHQ